MDKKAPSSMVILDCQRPRGIQGSDPYSPAKWCDKLALVYRAALVLQAFVICSAVLGDKHCVVEDSLGKTPV